MGIQIKPPDITEPMKTALEMVAGGKSLQCVAKSTGVPKTVLWRQVKKSALTGSDPRLERFKVKPKSKYSDMDRAQAIEGLKQGVSLCKLSAKFKIPKATLFREKVKLEKSNEDNDSVPNTLEVVKETADQKLEQNFQDTFVLD